MKRLLVMLLLLLGSAIAARANDSAQGWCEEGNQQVITSGLRSTTRVQASHPSCIITVNVHGGGLATIYSDNNLTPLANPFTSQSDGQWQFYAANGRYDVVMTSAGFSQTITYSDILLCDPFELGSTCNNGGTVQAHDLLSTTHLDTIPASPPVRGDLVTAQNQTSPTGVNPSWARLPLGTSGQVLLSNGTDALWGTLTAGTGITITNNTGSLTISTSGGGGGCSPPGTDTGVLSEHPVGTCYDSAHFTFDDTAHNLQVTNSTSPNTVGTNNTYIIGPGNTAASSTFSYILGDSNDTHSATRPDTFVIGTGNSINALSNVAFAASVSIGTSNTQGDAANAGSGGNNVFSLGVGNTLYKATNVVSIGANSVGIDGASGSTSAGFVAGGFDIANCVQGSNCSSAGTGTVSNFGIVGDSNLINWHGTGTVSTAYLFGFDNRVDTVVGNTGQSFLYGFDNENDGSVGNDVAIFGVSNTAHNSQVASCLGASDSGIWGMVNNVTGSGNYAVYGGGNTVTSKNCVAMLGFNMTAPASNGVFLGVSSTPEVQITASTIALPQVVTITATAFASLGTPANGTFKYCNDCTIANPCAGSGTGALAKRLAGVWVCN